ncbi:hypothetical protein RQP46_010082 [Phenoliferia psychrophenolica]
MESDPDSPKKGSLSDILCHPMRSKREARPSSLSVASSASGAALFSDDDDDAEVDDLDDGSGAWVKRVRKKPKLDKDKDKDGKGGKEGVVKGARKSRSTGGYKGPERTLQKGETALRKSGRLGRLATALTGLPIEMLSEILSHSTPATLLRLSRTAKIFRELLFTKSSRPIWLRAFNNDGFPERFQATDFNEPTLARLIWDKECWICGRLKVHKIIWTLRARYCDVCLKQELLPKTELEVALHEEQLHPDVWSCVPRITRPPWSYAQIHGEFYIGWALKAASRHLKALALADAAEVLSTSPALLPSSTLPFSSLPPPTTPTQQASNVALLVALLFPPHLQADRTAALAHLDSHLFNAREPTLLLSSVYHLARARLLAESHFLRIRELAVERQALYPPLPSSTPPTPAPAPAPAAAAVPPPPIAAAFPAVAAPAPAPAPPAAAAVALLDVVSSSEGGLLIAPTQKSRVTLYLEKYAENLPKIEKDSRMLEEWQKSLDRARAEERSNAQRDRLDAIVGHLTKAGYSDEDIVIGVTPGTPVYAYIDQPYPLTERIWRKVGPIIKAFIASHHRQKADEALSKARDEALALAARPAPLPSDSQSSDESWRSPSKTAQHHTASLLLPCTDLPTRTHTLTLSSNPHKTTRTLTQCPTPSLPRHLHSNRIRIPCIRNISNNNNNNSNNNVRNTPTLTHTPTVTPLSTTIRVNHDLLDQPGLNIEVPPTYIHDTPHPEAGMAESFATESEIRRLIVDMTTRFRSEELGSIFSHISVNQSPKFSYHPIVEGAITRVLIVGAQFHRERSGKGFHPVVPPFPGAPDSYTYWFDEGRGKSGRKDFVFYSGGRNYEALIMWPGLRHLRATGNNDAKYEGTMHWLVHTSNAFDERPARQYHFQFVEDWYKPKHPESFGQLSIGTSRGGAGGGRYAADRASARERNAELMAQASGLD